MDWHDIEANWKHLQERVRARWDKLTEEDLATVSSNGEALPTRIRERYGIPKEEADRELEDWIKEPGVLDDWNDRRAI